MKIIFLLLSGLFLFQINVLSQNDFPDERTKRDYKEIISLYPDFLVSHLPKTWMMSSLLIQDYYFHGVNI